ncbi:4a-hydroxytetrahydrobiopterin dehydratase [Arthrobacter sulfonylureivorans]|uniref:Putative pterin-4-alpha-carbinolamine dehydratase n=1 Tax=Arthrobacter sulfonylureivorans TaxID=2486855 RepID=A0ABY3W9H6_9MICC|nr:4a-hydroxytetrahydrobiopterin dehydratase [Arthrobacter sulfonylureivorans]UNK47008.1 4a-hydroxytetrahydrobiopterin dehydratase [Arthrobacter sulfonylureivorans]
MGRAKDVLSSEEIDRQLIGLPQWRYAGGALVSVFTLDNGREALNFIASVGDLAEEQQHHPDLDWRYNKVFLRFTSHDADAEVTTRDVSAAAAVSVLAGKLSADADPDAYPG